MKAIGIARQSHGDGASVEDQTVRIREHAKREGWDLVDVLPEQDVSGGRPLDKRPGLGKAVRMIEEGKASIIVVAYFDRLVRSLKVQAEVVERVEAAGGRILTLDVGEVSTDKAASWLSATFLGTVAEYHRRATSERVKAAHAARRSQGLWTGGKLPFYRVVADGVVKPDASKVEVVREAFRYRLSGRSVAEVLTLLRERTGLPLPSLNIAQRMLADESLVAEGIVPAATFRRCQTLVTKRGTRPKSARLLARLGVLRCSLCGGSLNVHGSEGPNQVYRCHRGCGVAISVKLAEDTVSHEVRCALRDFRGNAGGTFEELEETLREKQAAFDRLVMAFDGHDADSIRARLAVAQGEIDAAGDALEDARAAAGFTLSPSLDWHEGLSQDERRELIRNVVSTAVVSLAGAYVSVREEILRGLQGELREEFERLFKPLGVPTTFNRYGGDDSAAFVQMANEALLRLRTLEGWIQGLIDQLTLEQRLRIEAEERAKLEAKPTTGFGL